MTEIKKFTKIVLIVDAILWFMFTIFLIFIFDMTMNPEGWTNPYLPKLFGGVIFVSAIFAILMLRKKEWEEIKLLFAYFIGLLISTLFFEATVFAIVGFAFGTLTIMVHSFNITVEAVLLALAIISWIKQRV
ncbi:MAG: hypothetical protein EAX91_02070 [Candidatus Lokiarchaeota archaeon]|nr:hypothetical protein [Candidatus Lokiarchaeota archaeon]